MGAGLVGLAAWCPVRPGIVLGASMEPTLHPGQPFLYARDAASRHAVGRGDVVVLHVHGETLIKRIYALGGDVVWTAALRADPDTRFPLSLGAPIDQCRRRYPGMIFERVIVPRDCLYVVGENNGSVDSRDFGPVPASGVRGRVITVAADPGVPAVGFRVPPAPKRHASATTPAAAPA